MNNKDKTVITVETTIKATIEKVWRYWTEPEHIKHWCNASDDWHATYAENDLKVHGKFKTTMAAKDGSVSFDFEGIYTTVQKYKEIDYNIGDGRTVRISFSNENNEIKVIECFEAETVNPYEMQKGGWQSILDNFKKYTETNQG